jgi:hypothetical protein
MLELAEIGRADPQLARKLALPELAPRAQPAKLRTGEQPVPFAHGGLLVCKVFLCKFAN